MKKVLKISGIIIGSFAVLIFIFALLFVNREDLSFESGYKSIQTETLKNNQDLYVVYIFSPDCPAIRKKGPYVKEDFDWLKENGIDYYLVADVIYNSRVD